MAAKRKQGRAKSTGRFEAHTPTAELRARIRQMSGFGLTQEEILILTGLGSVKTLTKYYAYELAVGWAEINMQIGGSLARQAIGAPAQYDDKGNKIRDELLPDKSCAIFLGKTRLGLRETKVIELDLTQMYDLTKLDVAELKALDRILEKADRNAGAGAAANDDVPRKPAERNRPARSDRLRPGGNR